MIIITNDHGLLQRDGSRTIHIKNANKEELFKALEIMLSIREGWSLKIDQPKSNKDNGNIIQYGMKSEKLFETFIPLYHDYIRGKHCYAYIQDSGVAIKEALENVFPFAFKLPRRRETLLDELTQIYGPDVIVFEG